MKNYCSNALWIASTPFVNRQKQAAFTIRAATHEDCDEVLQCLGLAFAPYRDVYTPEAFLDTVLTPETLRQRMTDMAIFVATAQSEQVIGTVACRMMGNGRGHLRGMAVRPEWQGCGVSESLLKAAEEHLCRSGCNLITLNTTEPLKKASRFYEKHGFRRTGKLGQFFGMTLLEYSKSSFM